MCMLCTCVCVFCVCACSSFPNRQQTPVVRREKLKPNLPKLVVPSNEPLDEYELEDLRRAARPKMISPSPTPSPIPGEYLDPDFDPDNVVIRGAVSDDEDAVKPKKVAGDDVTGNGLNDFTFNTHS